MKDKKTERLVKLLHFGDDLLVIRRKNDLDYEEFLEGLETMVKSVKRLLEMMDHE
jgi:hypothetical protein